MSKGLLKAFRTIGLALTLGVSMSACAGLSGLGGDSWKEEVLLHDGQKIIVERSVTRGGRHEIGQKPPYKEQSLSFTVPGANQTITWEDHYSQDLGMANFLPMALDVRDGVAYLVVKPMGCLSYNKWGRPNPPYVIFKYDGKAWQRIQLPELPSEIRMPNLIGSSPDTEVEKSGKHFFTAEWIKAFNAKYKQPEYRSILREAIHRDERDCGEMIYGGKEDGGTGGWHGIGLFGDTYEACLNYCWQHKISKRYCPCETLFKGEK